MFTQARGGEGKGLWFSGYAFLLGWSSLTSCAAREPLLLIHALARSKNAAATAALALLFLVPSMAPRFAAGQESDVRLVTGFFVGTSGRSTPPGAARLDSASLLRLGGVFGVHRRAVLGARPIASSDDGRRLSPSQTARLGWHRRPSFIAYACRADPWQMRIVQ